MALNKKEFPTARDLAEIYRDEGEHPRLPREDWKTQVMDDETLLNYWDWVEKEVFLAGGESELKKLVD